MYCLSSGNWKSEIKVSAGLVPSEGHGETSVLGFFPWATGHLVDPRVPEVLSTKVSSVSFKCCVPHVFGTPKTPKSYGFPRHKPSTGSSLRLKRHAYHVQWCQDPSSLISSASSCPWAPFLVLSLCLFTFSSLCVFLCPYFPFDKDTSGID